jgi:lantibiotic modifying enzyme
LLANVEHISTNMIGWRTPSAFRSSFSGRTFYGFAHGTAGIATFLLAMATVTGRDEFHQVASAAAASLVWSSARRDELVGWGEGPDRPPAFLAHWCNGASGVGSFLLRWWKVSRDASLVPVIEGAARTVMATKWRSGVAYCHGLAGNADFLLDAANILEDDRYRLWAADLASVIYDRRVVQDGLCTFGDQTGLRTPDFNVGLSGVLSFFLRLRHGGPRLWMVDF